MVIAMRGKVVVLLAAYNGQQWLEQQVQSILKQSSVQVRIVISVDVSKDDTEGVVEELSKKYSNIEFLPMGKKFGGAARNFYRLILETRVDDDEYIAFSDQDDIWLENKLSTAIYSLKDNDFYSSNVTAFWENGQKCEIIKSQPFVDYDHFFEAAGPGCTYVIRKDAFLELRNFIIDNQQGVNNIALHDWLIYAFARERNFKWHIDDKSGMLYRQHENNQVGANNSFKSIVKRFGLVKDKWYRNQVRSIMNFFPTNENKLLIENIDSGYIGNLKLLACIRKLRRRLRDRILLGMALMFNFF